jgi:predicted outer membrane repeat protein
MKSNFAHSRRLAAAITLALAAVGARAATITVNSADDAAASTFCNLRNAIASAVGGASTANCVGQATGVYADPDTIQFAPSLANATVTMTQGAFPISGVAIDLVGSGQTIQAGGLSRIFSVYNGSTLSANNLTITGGHSSSYGGAIAVDSGSALILNNSTVSASTAVTRGGGIYTNGGTVTLTNTTVSGNSATTDGGGIYANGGTLSLSGSTISNNTATARGGGVLSSHSNVLTVDHSTLAGNSGLRSGAVYLGPQSTTTITLSTVSGNTGDCSSSFCGGGIYAWASDLRIVDSTLSGNTASGTKDFQAGAVYLYNANATIVNSTITGNSAYGSGGTGNDYLAGALWELHDSASSQGSLTLVNTTVSGNTASASVSAGAYVGGGIAVGVQGTGGDVGVATLYNTIVTTNSPANTDFVFKPSAATWTTAYNLLGSSQNIAAFNDPGNHNIFGDTPGLDLLQNNGGPTQTMALLAASPALQAGSPVLAVFSGQTLNYDQRGVSFVRTLSGTIDIGAFEYQDGRIFANGMESAP